MPSYYLQRVLDSYVMTAGNGYWVYVPSDAPYTFVLKKGTEKDIVLEIKDLLEMDVPMPLESRRLGIRLVADIQSPPTETDGGKR